MEYLDPEKCPGERYGVEGIAHLASLEVRFQTQMWGEVEDSAHPALSNFLMGSSRRGLRRYTETIRQRRCLANMYTLIYGYLRLLTITEWRYIIEKDLNYNIRLLD